MIKNHTCNVAGCQMSLKKEIHRENALKVGCVIEEKVR
jgi:hypothetical protein